MGILDKIMTFFAKKPAQTEPSTAQAVQPVEQATAVAEEPVEKIKMTPEEFEDFLRKGGRMDYALSKIENVEEKIKSISEHPIQKQIIDHELMTNMLEILKEININTSSLHEIKSRVDSLPTMPEIYSVVQQMATITPEAKKKLDQMAGKVASELDELYLTYLQAKRQATAVDVASELKISRNTASERLNKLVELGKAKKFRKNRKVFFSLASETPS